MSRIVFLGSGNLATHLAMALSENNHEILQVYSRTLGHAESLAMRIGCDAIDTIEEIIVDADCYILSLKDSVVKEVVRQIGRRISEGADNNNRAVFLHTAGSMPMDVFEGIVNHYGVLYPMQTFSKDRQLDFREIPCFIEANDSVALKVIYNLADSVSDRVIKADSRKRKVMHLAAVLAGNLANHCYRLSERVLEEEGIDFSLFGPLILETARKATIMSPRQAQTGPMVRQDTNVMDMQLSMIKDERTRQIYQLMAESIKENS